MIRPEERQVEVRPLGKMPKKNLYFYTYMYFVFIYIYFSFLVFRIYLSGIVLHGVELSQTVQSEEYRKPLEGETK